MSGQSMVPVSLLLVASLIVFPGLAQACAVCYGATDSPLATGVNNGILFLLAVIAVVQVGFIALFLRIRQHALRERRRKQSFQLIRGGAG